MARRVRYLDHMEPLVQCVEDTVAKRSVAVAHDTLAVDTMHF